MSGIVKVAVAININSLFTYSLPDNVEVSKAIGCRVLIDFRHRKIMGYVVEPGDDESGFQIKEIIRVIDESPVFSGGMVEFARWISDYYFCGIGEALSLMIPKGVRPKYIPQKENSQLNPISSLTSEQEEVYGGIKSDIAAGLKRFYLYGITGSGKTEIYIKLINDVIASGKQVIYLVPEIALSTQTLSRLRDVFGCQCAVLHSGLTGSVRLGEYMRLKNGEAMIAVGPRSAIFAPVSNLGLIIIDEEHDNAYKSEESPRFHARSAALWLANKYDASVILGSATPGVESWYHAKRSYFKLYELKTRYGGAVLPEIRLIDTSGMAYGRELSGEMTKEINERLQKKEQVILLQNRRGFSNYLKCKDCSEIISCPRCSIALTYHKKNGKVICHRCGFARNLPITCSKCGSSKFNLIGAGTERIESETTKYFSHARVLRIDYDTVSKSKDINGIFDKISNKEIDIIVGTQMISKGIHFPDIKFVGIVDADIFLNIPDYKAPERAFSLITQTAGRAGRSGSQGLVMIQTNNPDHYAISAAVCGDYETFFKEEIGYRQMMGMPPFMRLVRLVVRGKDDERAKEDATVLYKMICDKGEELKENSVEILGVSKCMIEVINSSHRYQILLKSKKMENMKHLLENVIPFVKIKSGNYLEIDVDPSDLF